MGYYLETPEGSAFCCSLRGKKSAFSLFVGSQPHSQYSSSTCMSKTQSNATSSHLSWACARRPFRGDKTSTHVPGWQVIDAVKRTGKRDYSLKEYLEVSQSAGSNAAAAGSLQMHTMHNTSDFLLSLGHEAFLFFYLLAKESGTGQLNNPADWALFFF